MPFWLRVAVFSTLLSATLGVFGLSLIVGAFPEFARNPNFAIGALFFVGAAAASWLSLRGSRRGEYALFLLQFPQILAFSVGSRFVVQCGAVGQLIVASEGYRLEGGWKGHFMISAIHRASIDEGAVQLVLEGGNMSRQAQESATWIVAINFLACYFAVKLWRRLQASRPGAVGDA